MNLLPINIFSSTALSLETNSDLEKKCYRSWEHPGTTSQIESLLPQGKTLVCRMNIKNAAKAMARRRHDVDRIVWKSPRCRYDGLIFKRGLEIDLTFDIQYNHVSGMIVQQLDCGVQTS